ncbi:MAG: alkaline phosphatase D family protein [Actinomycetes bacterium]
MSSLSRRSLLVLGAAGAVAASTQRPPVALAAVPGRLPDVFTLGVASGDPTPSGVVLWTRLAAEPLAEDGLGGMPQQDLPVQWQVAEDPSFRRVVRSGETRARAADAHSVHVEVEGLQPGREYWYRFRCQGQLTEPARTLTAPAAGATSAGLTMAVASCSQFEHGWFTAYRHIADENPDVVLHLGDYFYEYRAGTYVAPGGNVRDHRGPETETLAGYRQRHAQYRTDPDLQAAHAAAPWLVVWDDHEVDNNWADEVPENPQPYFLERRASAFRAYYENMPLRRTSVPRGIDLQLYRRIEWGGLASLHMLDTRQYRDDQACGDGARTDCAEALDPSRTITGDAQEAWLLDGMAGSTATWQVLGQQVFFSQRDFTAGAVQRFSMDGWDGYVGSRERILSGIVDRGVANPVVLTGDVHRHYACDVKADFDDPSSATLATELVTTSITSGGNGSDTSSATDVQLAENPHIRFANSQRGYVLARFEPEQLRADFKVLDYVTDPGSPVSTRASFVVEAGRPGLQPA